MNLMRKKLFVLIIFLVITIFGKAQSWEPVGGGLLLPDSAYDPTTYALCVYKDKLYAGGAFLFAGDKKVNYIACWDGSKWDTVGSGMNGTVKALCVYKGQLYAGGNFTKAGGKRANRIAKWDGKKWMPLGNGVHSGNYDIKGEDICIRSLCIYRNELYACGDFMYAGDNKANCIAKWDSLHWSRVGKPLNGGNYSSEGAGIDYRSLSMIAYEGKLYVGGYIMWAGDLKLNLARYNGQKFDSVPGVINRQDSIPPIYPIGVYKGKLLVAIGGFYIRGKKFKGMVQWNDTAWSDFSGEMKGQPKGYMSFGQPGVICIDSNNLYVGGTFSKIGGIEANNIAMWNGTSWQILGEGLDIGNLHPKLHMTLAVSSLAIYKGYLYAGGYFNDTRGKPLYHIARWKLDK